MLVDFEEFGIVGECVNRVLDVVGLLRTFGDESVESGRRAVPGIVRGLARRIVQIIRGQIAEKFADHGQAFGIVAGNEMRDAAGGIVGHRAAEFLFGDFLVSDGLDHVRAGDEHVGRVARHKNKIGDGR